MALWPFLPDYEAGPFVETLEWQTSVIQARAGEQRISHRSVPRIGLAASYWMSPAQLAKAQGLFRSMRTSKFWLPVWTEVEEVGAISAHTATIPASTVDRRFYAGDSCVVWDADDDCEVCEIQTVATSSLTLDPWVVAAYQDACVCPVVEVRFAPGSDLSVSRTSSDYCQVTARFVGEATRDLSSLGGINFQQYGGKDVLSYPHILNGSLTDVDEQQASQLDSVAGKFEMFAATATVKTSTIRTWRPLSLAETWDARCWLYTKRGRWKSVWIPSWNRDAVVTRAIALGDAEIEIESCGFASNHTLPIDIIVMAVAGQDLCARVTGVTAGDPGKELLALSSATSSAWALDNIDRLSKLTLCRSDSDRIDIRHSNGRSALVSIPWIEVPE